MSDFRNIAEAHRRQAERLGPQVAVRYKRGGPFLVLTWSDYRADVLACAAALVGAGVRPGDRVGRLGENRIEWIIADLGTLAAGELTVRLKTRRGIFERYRSELEALYCE
jgi:long-chain acyl-CoA synthetase